MFKRVHTLTGLNVVYIDAASGRPARHQRARETLERQQLKRRRRAAVATSIRRPQVSKPFVCLRVDQCQPVASDGKRGIIQRSERSSWPWGFHASQAAAVADATIVQIPQSDGRVAIAAHQK